MISFGWANLQMELPRNIEESSVAATASGWAATREFGDSTVAEAGKTLFNHLTYAASLMVAVIIFHVALLQVLGRFLCRTTDGHALPIPGFLKFPQLEIKVAQALACGFLDVSANVLTRSKVEWGWRGLAVLETICVGLFLRWFFGRGADFVDNVTWKPNATVTANPVACCKGKKLTTESQREQKKDSLESSGGNNEDSQSNVIAFETASFPHRIFAMVFESRNQVGFWQPNTESGSVDEPYGRVSHMKNNSNCPHVQHQICSIDKTSQFAYLSPPFFASPRLTTVVLLSIYSGTHLLLC